VSDPVLRIRSNFHYSAKFGFDRKVNLV